MQCWTPTGTRARPACSGARQFARRELGERFPQGRRAVGALRRDGRRHGFRVGQRRAEGQVAVLADGPRGYDTRNDAVQITLLRSPRFPDPEADRGRQHITWSVRVLDGGLDVAALEAAKKG